MRRSVWSWCGSLQKTSGYPWERAEKLEAGARFAAAARQTIFWSHLAMLWFSATRSLCNRSDGRILTLALGAIAPHCVAALSVYRRRFSINIAPEGQKRGSLWAHLGPLDAGEASPRRRRHSSQPAPPSQFTLTLFSRKGSPTAKYIKAGASAGEQSLTLRQCKCSLLPVLVCSNLETLPNGSA
jgi:hypothetical protein